MTRAVVRSAIATLVLSAGASAQSLDLGNLENTISAGLSSPVFMANAPGDPVTRLFVVNQPGTISLAINGTVQATPFLNLASLATTTLRVVGQTGTGVSRGSEQGLLSVAFDPDYNTPGALNNGYFYVYYIAPRGSTFLSSGVTFDRGRTIVARIRRSSVNPDVADLSTFAVIMQFDQPASNHNGGCMYFGPDGMLYIGTGDGGGANDNAGATNNALNPALLLGKLLRIDPRLQTGDNALTHTYRIPAGNPTSWPDSSGNPVAGARLESYAKGLRNPWRFSFDRLGAIIGDPNRSDLYIADVGQDVWEEINFVQGVGAPGLNYGWRTKEGFATTGLSGGTQNTTVNLTDPIYVYSHGSGALQGFSVTGGFVYRGTRIPGWRGRYFFADYVTNRIWSARVDRSVIPAVWTDFQDMTAMFNTTTGGSVAPNPSSIASFNEDNAGEMYIVQLNGRVRKIVPSALSLGLSLADVAQIGGAPGPDNQRTVDDIITFVNAYSDGELVPADVTDIGDTGAGPDNQLTVDDIIAFVNAFSA